MVRSLGLALLLVASPAVAAPTLRVAVYDLTVVDLSPRVGAVTTEAIAAEFRKYAGVNVLGLSEVRALLDHEQNRQMLGCETDSCLAEIGGALGVDALILGQVGRLGGDVVLALKRVRTKDGVTEFGTSRAVPQADGSELLSVVGDAVAAILPDHVLQPGMLPGVNVEFVELLRPPPIPRWVIAATVAVAGAVALGSGGFALASRVNGAQWDSLVAAAKADPDHVALDTDVAGPIRAQGLAQVDVARVLAIVAGALGGVAALEAPFVDWNGYADWKPGRPAPVR